MKADILIPCRGIETGKTRLSPVLRPAERAALCRRFLLDSIAVAQRTGARVAVVTAEPAAAELARSAGARILPDPGQGLNAALAEGSRQLGNSAPLLVLPTDLPLITETDLRSLLDNVTGSVEVALCPDRRGQGTNLLALSSATRAGFPFAFGVGSLDAHSDHCISNDLAFRVACRAGPDTDIDTPQDLNFWLRGADLDFSQQGSTHEAA